MTSPYPIRDLVPRLVSRWPQAVLERQPTAVVIRPDEWIEIARSLRDEPDLGFEFLRLISGVDFIDDEYFEVVYQLLSLQHGRTATIKVRTADREDPVVVPSVVTVWAGADLMEREVYDLMGIIFAGHPDLRRVFMWEDFEGYPLRKDYYYQNFPRKYGA